MTETSYYLSRGGQQWGPFNIDQVRELYRSGRLAADDLIWPGAGEWQRVGTLAELQMAAPAAPVVTATASAPVPAAAPAATSAAADAPTFFTVPLEVSCRDHPGRPALGGCTRCGAILCDECLRFQRGCICCAACADRVKKDLADPGAQTPGERLISAVRQRPALGIGLLVIAFFLLDTVAGSRHWETIPGIEEVKTAGRYQQSLRAAWHGLNFYRNQEEERGGVWLELSATAAGAVLTGTRVDEEYRRTCRILRLQAALLRGEPERLSELITDAAGDRDRRFQATLDFFSACARMLASDDPAGAEKIMARLEREFRPAYEWPGARHDPMLAMLSRAGLATVTPQQYWYYRGDALLRQGKAQAARTCFARVAQEARPGLTGDDDGGEENSETYWSRLARERLDE